MYTFFINDEVEKKMKEKEKQKKRDIAIYMMLETHKRKRQRERGLNERACINAECNESILRELINKGPITIEIAPAEYVGEGHAINYISPSSTIDIFKLNILEELEKKHLVTRSGNTFTIVKRVEIRYYIGDNRQKYNQFCNELKILKYEYDSDKIIAFLDTRDLKCSPDLVFSVPDYINWIENIWIDNSDKEKKPKTKIRQNNENNGSK